MTNPTPDPDGTPNGKTMSKAEFSAFNDLLHRNQRAPTNAELAAALKAKDDRFVDLSLMGGNRVRLSTLAKPAIADPKPEAPSIPVVADRKTDPGGDGGYSQAIRQFVLAHDRLPTGAENELIIEELDRPEDPAPVASPATPPIDPNAPVNAKGLSKVEFEAAQEFMRIRNRLPTNAELANAIRGGRTRHRGHSVDSPFARRGVM